VADVHFGTPGGEFRSNYDAAGIARGTPIVDLGVALKVAF
jgi:hypothetical protein